MDKNRTERLIRLKTVLNQVGLSRSTVYALVKAGQFPKQYKLHSRAVGWLDSEVSEWIAARTGTGQAGVMLSTSRTMSPAVKTTGSIFDLPGRTFRAGRQ